MTTVKNILAASAAVLALIAGSSYAATDEALAERIKPYGSVCVVGDPCAEVVAAAPVAAPAAASAGETLFQGKGCVACHNVDNKLVGPALKEVAGKYAGQADAVAHLVDSITHGSSGRWGAIPMPPNAVSDEEAATLAEWVLSLK